MTDNDIIKAVACCIKEDCENCPYFASGLFECGEHFNEDVLNLINRQKAENNDLFCKLTGVMHSVDKWLSVDELKQDEVVRAITMREKTLQIVEKLHEKIEELEEKEMLRASKAEAVKEFAERLKSRLITVTYMNFDDIIDNLVKEMVGAGNGNTEKNN